MLHWLNIGVCAVGLWLRINYRNPCCIKVIYCLKTHWRSLQRKKSNFWGWILRVWNYEKKCHGYGYLCALFDWKQISKLLILFCLISQHLIGNSDKSSVVVRVFSSPFAAQFVRILPKTDNNAQCMRVDLFGCRDCKCSILCYTV